MKRNVPSFGKYPAAALFGVLFISALSAQSFQNGVHLRNDDDVPRTVVYREYVLTTRICFCDKPTPTMKNGLAPASLREGIEGFTIVSQKVLNIGESEVTAVIAPHKTVWCLSASTIFSIRIDGTTKDELKGVADKTIVIKNGKLKLE